MTSLPSPHLRRREACVHLRRSTLTLLATLAIVLGSWLYPPSAAAHAALKESNPSANAVLATQPTSVTLRYTERLERSYSKADLYDQNGTLVPGATSRAGDSAYVMVVDLPPGLPNGTYTVVWRNLSADDGHTAQGYVPFTIGTEADIRVVAPPVVATTTSGPSDATPRRFALAGADRAGGRRRDLADLAARPPSRHRSGATRGAIICPHGSAGWPSPRSRSR